MTVDWQDLFEAVFESRKAFDERGNIVFGCPATAEEIGATFSEFGFKAPQEFVSLYSTFNGVGSTSPHSPKKTDWWFLPLEQIAFLHESFQRWVELHDDLADAFLPFIDFGGGGKAGYFRSGGIATPETIFEFDNGAYEFDEDQEISEFILELDDSIYRYVSSRIYRKSG